MKALEDKFIFEKEIKIINAYNPNLKAPFKAVIKRSQKELYNLRNQILSNNFESIESEIRFFKEVKNKPLQILILSSELKSFEARFPKGNKIKQKKYILNYIKKVNRFFNNNSDFCQYLKMDCVHFDTFYFTRKHFSEFASLFSAPFFRDPDFSTSHDLLLAKYHAFHELIKYMEKRLQNIINPTFEKLSNSSLKWTSSKVALTELTYALYHGGAVNNGNSDIIEIANALQQTFNFPIGDVYRTYTEIRSRKNKRAKFLDELSISLISGMDSKDE